MNDLCLICGQLDYSGKNLQLESGDLDLKQNLVVVTMSVAVFLAHVTLGFSCLMCKAVPTYLIMYLEVHIS